MLQIATEMEMTTDRIAQERRYNEFKQNETLDMQYFGSVAADILHADGWQFVAEQVRRANYQGLRGWWVKPESEHARPMGDSNYFKESAYRTVALYTVVPFEQIQQTAAEYRRHDLKLALQSMA